MMRANHSSVDALAQLALLRKQLNYLQAQVREQTVRLARLRPERVENDGSTGLAPDKGKTAARIGTGGTSEGGNGAAGAGTGSGTEAASKAGGNITVEVLKRQDSLERRMDILVEQTLALTKQVEGLLARVGAA